MLAVEIAVQDARGVQIASDVRPDRIELCSALALGGLTPSIGFTRSAVEVLRPPGVGVHVLVRPRAGGFEFDASERATMLGDIESAVAAGADGVVIGALDGREIDLGFVRDAVVAAAGAEVTFHRAFDVLAGDHAVARAGAIALADTGVARILTSGGRPTAPEAVDELAALVSSASGAIQIMAGGSIRAEHVAPLAAAGVDAVHGSAKGAVSYVAPVTLGSGAATGEAAYDSTDAAEAQRLVDAARAL